MSYRAQRYALSGVLYIFLAIGAVMTAFPFFWMITGSFKSTPELFRIPVNLLPRDWLLTHYIALFTTRPYARWYANTIFLAVTQTFLVLFFCSLAGYGFGKYNFRGKAVLFGVLLSTLVIPSITTLIPSLYFSKNSFIFFLPSSSMRVRWVVTTSKTARFPTIRLITD